MALLVTWQDGCCTGGKGVGCVVQDLPPLLYLLRQQDQQSNSVSWLSLPPPLSPSCAGNRIIPLPLNTKIQFDYESGVEIRLPAKAGQRAWSMRKPRRNRDKSDRVAPRPGGLQTCVLHKSSATGDRKSALHLGWICIRKMFVGPFFCIPSHGASNKTWSSSFVGAGVLSESLCSLCTCKSRFSSRFCVCLATHKVVP